LAWTVAAVINLKRPNYLKKYGTHITKLILALSPQMPVITTTIITNPIIILDLW